MTTEQKEQQALALIAELPIFQRIRLALTVLRGSEPETIRPSLDEAARPWETKEFFAELDRRYEAMVDGTDPGIPAEEVLANISAELS